MDQERARHRHPNRPARPGAAAPQLWHTGAPGSQVQLVACATQPRAGNRRAAQPASQLELPKSQDSSSRPDQGVGSRCVLCRCPEAEHDSSTCAPQAIPSFREQRWGLVNVCVVIQSRHLLHHEHAHVSLRIPTVVWKEPQSPPPVRVRNQLCFALAASVTWGLADLTVSAGLMVSGCLIPIHGPAL